MKIYRGNNGIDLSLEEFSRIVQDDELMDDLLNTIYELEMDEVMSYNDQDILVFEQELFEEVATYQRAQSASSDIKTIERILKHLENQGR